METLDSSREANNDYYQTTGHKQQNSKVAEVHLLGPWARNWTPNFSVNQDQVVQLSETQLMNKDL